MKLLWLDLETDGNTPEMGGIILEIGVVATSADSALTSSFSFNSLVYNPCQISTVWELMPKVVQKMHLTNGLWDDWICMNNVVNAGDLHYSRVEQRLIALMEDTHPNEKWAIAGSGVSHFDMRFLRVFMPNLVAKCAYYQYDVGSVRRFLKLANRDDLLPRAADASLKTHRGLDDAMQHAAEARHYMQVFKKIN